MGAVLCYRYFTEAETQMVIYDLPKVPIYLLGIEPRGLILCCPVPFTPVQGGTQLEWSCAMHTFCTGTNDCTRVTDYPSPDLWIHSP